MRLIAPALIGAMVLLPVPAFASQCQIDLWLLDQSGQICVIES